MTKEIKKETSGTNIKKRKSRKSNTDQTDLHDKNATDTNKSVSLENKQLSDFDIMSVEYASLYLEGKAN